MPNRSPFIPTSILTSLSNKYKPGSVKVFSSSIKRLHKLLNIESFELDLLLDEETVLETLTEIPSSSRKTILNAVIRVLEHSDSDCSIPESYQEKLDELMQASFLEQKAINQNVSLQEIDILLHKTRPEAKSSRYDRLKHFVIALYRYIPPLRVDDYRSARVRARTDSEIETGQNYWNSDDSTLHLDSESRIIKFPESLVRITNQWLEHNVTEWLIPDKNNQPMSQQEFTHMMNRIFEKPVSISEIRKNYIKKYMPHLNPVRRIKLAELMAHSIDEIDTKSEVVIDMTNHE